MERLVLQKLKVNFRQLSLKIEMKKVKNLFNFLFYSPGKFQKP